MRGQAADNSPGQEGRGHTEAAGVLVGMADAVIPTAGEATHVGRANLVRAADIVTPVAIAAPGSATVVGLSAAQHVGSLIFGARPGQVGKARLLLGAAGAPASYKYISVKPSRHYESSSSRWKRMHREEREVFEAVRSIGVTIFFLNAHANQTISGEMPSPKGASAMQERDRDSGRKRRVGEGLVPTGSDLVFSFENNSAESMGYTNDEISISCKRVYMERVETVIGVDGLVKHVTEEVEDGEEEYIEKRRESVGEEKGAGEGQSRIISAEGTLVDLGSAGSALEPVREQ